MQQMHKDIWHRKPRKYVWNKNHLSIDPFSECNNPFQSQSALTIFARWRLFFQVVDLAMLFLRKKSSVASVLMFQLFDKFDRKALLVLVGTLHLWLSHE